MARERDDNLYDALKRQYNAALTESVAVEDAIRRLEAERTTAEVQLPEAQAEAALTLLDEVARISTDVAARAEVNPLLQQLGLRIGLTFGSAVKGKKRVVRQLVSGRMVFGDGPLPVPLFGKDNVEDGPHGCSHVLPAPGSMAEESQLNQERLPDGDRAVPKAVSDVVVEKSREEKQTAEEGVSSSSAAARSDRTPDRLNSSQPEDISITKVSRGEPPMTIAATVSAEEAARRTWDVVVVGAGPAGAMAAHELARCGLAVLLVDRASFPRWKVCGCCLNGRALATLGAAGLGQLTTRGGAVPLDGIQLAVAGRSARVPLSGSVSLSRETFDAALVTAAIEAGAAFLPRTHASLARGRDSRCVELRQDQTSARVAARLVIAADGLGGNLVVRAGVSAIDTTPAARIGMGVVAAKAPAFYAPGAIFMACGRAGYMGLVRLEDGRLDLAAAFEPAWIRLRGGPGHAAVELLAEVGWPAVPDLAELNWRGTPTLTRRARRLAAERLFLIGDAAGYIEPFTGEGMAWALAAGRAVAPLAVRAVARWHPGLVHEWTEVYRRLIGQRQIVCRTVAAVLRSPWLTRAAIHLLSRAPALAMPVVHYLGNGERPA